VSIKVLVVDDSAFMRHALGRLLGEADGIEVVGTAANGEQALAVIASLAPDVITLDVEMPVLGGLDMLYRLMVERPTRVIMLSSLTVDGARVTLEALAAGAIDFVAKPGGSLSVDIGRVGEELVAKVRAAAAMSEASWIAHRGRAVRATAGRSAPAPAFAPAMAGQRQTGPVGPAAIGRTADQTVAAVRRATITARRLVVIASSTGGPGALQTVVSRLPAKLDAAVVIVQHMPPGFTASLAQRLALAGPLPAWEAGGNDIIGPDQILVAPGDRHLISSLSGRVQLVGLPAVNGVRPAADVTLQAVAPVWRERLLTVVLTGMGHDGRDGVRAVKEHGGTVIAQDEATSTVWGMPGAVVEAGLADQVLPLDRIGAAIGAWAAAAASNAATAATPATRSRVIPDTAVTPLR
jgi:two-component system, chemotaxis family, protein-glutamate methylesterase/glutaminase